MNSFKYPGIAGLQLVVLLASQEPVRVPPPGRSFLHYHPADSTTWLTPSIRTWLDERGATLPEFHCNRRGEQVYVGGRLAVDRTRG